MLHILRDTRAVYLALGLRGRHEREVAQHGVATRPLRLPYYGIHRTGAPYEDPAAFELARPRPANDVDAGDVGVARRDGPQGAARLTLCTFTRNGGDAAGVASSEVLQCGRARAPSAQPPGVLVRYPRPSMARSIGSHLLALACVVLALVASPARAHATPPVDAVGEPIRARIHASLHYSGDAGCAEKEIFKNAVRSHLYLWEPWEPLGPWRVEVRVESNGSGYEGKALLFDPRGIKKWGKVVEGPASCIFVLRSLAFGLSAEILPPSPEPTCAPEPQAPVCPELPSAPAEPAEPEPKKVELRAEPGGPRFVPRLGAGARADFGPASAALFGVTVEGGLERQEWGWGGWSLMGTFRWDPQQTVIGPPTTGASPDVSSSLVAGRLAGCVYRAWPVSLAGCVVGELGELQQSAGTPSLEGFHQTALFAGGGVGAVVTVPLLAGLHIQMETDVMGVGKLAGGTTTWGNVIARSFGGAAGGLGAGLGGSF